MTSNKKKMIQKNFRLGPVTTQQLQELTALLGSESSAVRMAIDRLYADEAGDLARLRRGETVDCAGCGNPVHPGEGYRQPGTRRGAFCPRCAGKLASIPLEHAGTD